MRQFVEGAHQPGQGERVGAVLVLGRTGHAAHPVQVGAGGETRPGAFQHHDPHRAILGQRLQGRGEGADQVGVESVVQIRAVQAQADDRAIAVVLQRVGHAPASGIAMPE
jgi:hypothetical protein